MNNVFVVVERNISGVVGFKLLNLVLLLFGFMWLLFYLLCVVWLGLLWLVGLFCGGLICNCVLCFVLICGLILFFCGGGGVWGWGGGVIWWLWSFLVIGMLYGCVWWSDLCWYFFMWFWIVCLCWWVSWCVCWYFGWLCVLFFCYVG